MKAFPTCQALNEEGEIKIMSIDYLRDSDLQKQYVLGARGSVEGVGFHNRLEIQSK